MKRTEILIATIFIASLCAVTASAQEAPDGYVLVDSLVYRPAAAADPGLVGQDIYWLLDSDGPGGKADVNVKQDPRITSTMRAYMSSNASRTLKGFRVRIFFDNSRNARAESEAALKRFESIYHDVAAYRTYENPYFKVTVGDFRTKSEAMALLGRIKRDFPSAFVVKEQGISYPVVDRENAYIVDTVRVLKPVGQGL